MVQASSLAESGGIFSVSHELQMGVSAFGGALTCESCQRLHWRAGAAMGEYFMPPTVANIHRMSLWHHHTSVDSLHKGQVRLRLRLLTRRMLGLLSSESSAAVCRLPGNVSDVWTSRVRHDLALLSRDHVAEHHGRHTCTRDADEEGHQLSKVFGHANLLEKRVVVTDASRLFSRRSRQLLPWWDRKAHAVFVWSEPPAFGGSDHPSLIPFPTIQLHSDIPPILPNHRFPIRFNGFTPFLILSRLA